MNTKCTCIAILGSTGSIGTQALEIIQQYPELFRISALVAGSNVELLAAQCRKFLPRRAVIADEKKLDMLREALKGLPVETGGGAAAVMESMEMDETDMVLSATVGYSGLEPTLRAIEKGKDIALANKETLVVAGDLVTKLSRDKGVDIYPVDSEHSAIYQCLAGEKSNSVRRLIITASGGPFLHYDVSMLASVTPVDALRHPNWSMGAKITIDSATMMNKTFEIIEAKWLFDVPVEKIVPVVHPQSIVHSMVEFDDGAVKAQLGVPDMKIPIKYAMNRGDRLSDKGHFPSLTFEMMSTLTFEKPDYEKFPCLSLARTVSERGGNSACIMNAADEIAVAAFLKGRIKFTDIYRIVSDTLERVPFVANPTLNDYIETNKEARVISSLLIK